jgi:hypothetical protein
VEPFGELRVDGFRLSESAVAAFRFSTVARSYAARMGDARDVGVIGAAVFTERRAPEIAAAPPAPAPWDGAPRAEREQADAAPEGRAPQASSAAPSAPGAVAEKRARGERRPGLGTEFGEEHRSEVQWVRFERASASPAAIASLRYDDRPGLLALGIDVDGRRAASDDAWLRRTADPFRRNPGFAEPPPGWGR